jgi:hypothetical protein
MHNILLRTSFQNIGCFKPGIGSCLIFLFVPCSLSLSRIKTDCMFDVAIYCIVHLPSSLLGQAKPCLVFVCTSQPCQPCLAYTGKHMMAGDGTINPSHQALTTRLLYTHKEKTVVFPPFVVCGSKFIMLSLVQSCIKLVGYCSADHISLWWFLVGITRGFLQPCTQYLLRYACIHTSANAELARDQEQCIMSLFGGLSLCCQCLCLPDVSVQTLPNVFLLCPDNSRPLQMSCLQHDKYCE